ncbi:MAG: aminoacyl-histidine dipeptidase [Candidatus Aminicenantes bacterium]|nr:aminoacyl-histidine dipeptidase [Candidatus Aminicenantes bacterium]
MSNALSGLKPAHLWKHFEQILRIPHCSGCEKGLADYIGAQAKGLGLSWKKDKAGNVIVRRPASPGHENAETVIFQGHLDMVCEKNSDIKHDFGKDPIEAEIKNGWIHARGTTLGADNGIGAAACLAIMEDASLVHGPLEFLFTVDEETGLNGARGLEPGALKGKNLINLDSEEEGTFTIGCAGGAESEITFPIKRKTSRMKTAYRLKIGGLRGGHSGLDINQGRANALKLMARILWQAGPKFPLELIRIEGGNKHNAIPREAWADFLMDPAKMKSFKAFLEKSAADIKAEYGSVEKEFGYALDELKLKKNDPMTGASQAGLIEFLLACPHGVLRMHPEIAGLVETSTNLAILRCGKAAAAITCSSRSSVGPALEAARAMLRALVELSGAKAKQPAGYPGWAPDLSSKLLATLKNVHQKVFGKEARIVAVHAGLECGIIGEKFPGMDMISFGPTITHPHSPEEGVEIASVENFWKLLTATMQELA